MRETFAHAITRRQLVGAGLGALATLGLAACGTVAQPESGDATTGASADTASGTDVWQAIAKAYVYTFPLMMVDATWRRMTNAVEPTSTQAPPNQLIHAQKLATADFSGVVTPNVDTIYSQVMLDLTDDAVVFVKPATDRYCSVQVLDAYTNTPAVLGTGGDTDDARTYLLCGPDFSGEVPADMTRVDVPTNMGWVIVRTVCSGVDDEENVHAIQRQMDARPLALYQSGGELPAGTHDDALDYVPMEHVLALAPGDYFARANELMAANPPQPDDPDMLSELEAVGVGPGLAFDASALGEDAATRWKQMLGSLKEQLQKDCARFNVTNGVWRRYGEPIGEFGTEYEYRALVALAGLGANPARVAAYAQTQTDGDGGRLDGANRYVLHFDADALPPVGERGFWSVTAYDSSDSLLIDNPLDRYCVNDRSGMSLGADGSLDVYLQADEPEEGRRANWLPVCPGEFHLFLRVYLPQDAVLDGTWKAPTVARA